MSKNVSKFARPIFRPTHFKATVIKVSQYTYAA